MKPFFPLLAVLLRLRRARRRIQFVAHLEVRPLPPIRPEDRVRFAIAIQIAERRALRPVMRLELFLRERGERAFGGGEVESRGDAKDGKQREEGLHAAGCPPREIGGQVDCRETAALERVWASRQLESSLKRNYAICGPPPSRRLPVWAVREGNSHCHFWFTIQ